MVALRAALVDTEHTRRRNRAFLGALTERAAGRPDARSLALLAAHAEQVKRGPDARRVQWGRLPWTSPVLGLQRLAETAALEAAIAEDRPTADWLCTEILDSGRSAAAQGVRALLAVHDGDLSAARRLRERETKVLAGAYSRVAADWAGHQARRLAARRAYLAHADTGTGDAATRWAEARGSLAARAGAVADANRIGGSGSTGAAFEDAFVRALVAAEPTGLGAWSDALAPAPAEPADLAEPGAVTEVSVLTRRALRAHLAGRELSFGADAPDDTVVVRFDAIARDAGRTDVHVVTDPDTASWAVPVHTRIVLASQRAEWSHTLRTRLRPKAQRWLGDDELRRVAPDAVQTLLRDLAATS